MNTDEPRTVTLKNGDEVVRPLVATTMNTLRYLIDNDPIGFYELVTLCRNPRHTLWGSYGAKLAELGMIEQTGQPHSAVRGIVLSAVTGEMENMTLGSPTL